MRAGGEIHIGEASRWAGKAFRPLSGAPWPVIVGNVVSGLTVLAGMTICGLLVRFGAAPEWAWLPALIGSVALSVVTGPWACRTLATRIFRRRLLERETPNPLPTSVEITPDALIWRSGAVETRVLWSGVSEVNLVGPYWVVMAQATPIFIPRRYFAEQPNEAAFISALLERLSPAARARSKTGNLAALSSASSSHQA